MHFSVAELPAVPEPGAIASSLRDAAYQAIKLRIITCAYRPGEYLNEAQVSAAIGIGRTPVHQAIERLMLEGMVEVIPRKGVIVRPVSLHEVLELVDVRMVNESYGVRLAARHADEAELAALDAILARADAAVALRDVERLMLLDRDFHFGLARAARNDVLSAILERLHERSLRFWFISLDPPEHHRSVQAEHADLLAAIRAHDEPAAEEAVRAHIESFRRNVSRYL
jgi:DNA-binding GntR family transcriptional regulator